MNIIFVEPFFPQNQRRFVAALAGVGANVIGVGEYAEDEFGDELRSQLGAYYRVSNVTDEGQLNAAVEWAQGLVWVDRLESTIESHQMAAARVREARGIPGTSVRTTWLCRDKPSMKEALRQAGVPTAASTAAHSVDDAVDFANADRLPADPQAAGRRGSARHHPGGLDGRAAAGARWRSGTPTRSRSRSSSKATRASTTRSPSTATSRTTGSRTTTPTCWRPCGTAGSRHSSSPPTGSTTPRPTARSARWAPGSSRRSGSAPRRPTWSGSTDPRDCVSPRSAAARRASARGTSTRRPTTPTSTGSGPRRSCTARSSGPLSRAYSAGIVALRPSQDGRIQGYSGVEEIQQRHGPWILDAHLPDVGHRHPAGGGGLHGQRLGPDETPRLRHPARDARRRGAHGSGARRMRRAQRSDEDGPARAPTVPHDRRRGDPHGRARGHRRHGDRGLAGPRERHRRARRHLGGSGPAPAPLRPADRRARQRPAVRRGRARPSRRRGRAGRDLLASAAACARQRVRRAAAPRPDRPRHLGGGRRGPGGPEHRPVVPRRRRPAPRRAPGRRPARGERADPAAPGRGRRGRRAGERDRDRRRSCRPAPALPEAVRR